MNICWLASFASEGTEAHIHTLTTILVSLSPSRQEYKSLMYPDHHAKYLMCPDHHAKYLMYPDHHAKYLMYPDHHAKYLMYLDHHAKYLLFFRDFNQNRNVSTNFSTKPTYKISWKSVRWEMDMTRLIFAFRNCFANAPQHYS